MINKFKPAKITVAYLIISTIVTMLGVYFLNQRLDILGWALIEKEWPMYLLMYLAVISVIWLFWALSSMIDSCENETAIIFSEMKQHIK